MNSDLWEIYRNNAYTHIYICIYTYVCVYIHIDTLHPDSPLMSCILLHLLPEVGGKVEKEERGRREGEMGEQWRGKGGRRRGGKGEGTRGRKKEE